MRDSQNSWRASHTIASGLNGRRIATAKLAIAVTANSVVEAAKTPRKRGSSFRCASTSAVPLAPKPNSAIEMII